MRHSVQTLRLKRLNNPIQPAQLTRRLGSRHTHVHSEVNSTHTHTHVCYDHLIVRALASTVSACYYALRAMRCACGAVAIINCRHRQADAQAKEILSSLDAIVHSLNGESTVRQHIISWPGGSSNFTEI